jgi:hypothetical protein
MIITTASGTSYDSQTDLSPEERHILQKLYLWESMASSVEEFRERTDEALQKGWNNSGPVRAGAALKDILRDLETKVDRRLNA